MKLYRIDKLAKIGGAIIKKKHVLAGRAGSGMAGVSLSARLFEVGRWVVIPSPERGLSL